MNYKISLSEMDELALQENSKKRKISLEEMRHQASGLKHKSQSKLKKHSA